ncbi:reverse transcriptase domain-containing protein [Tanacetum coccineum]|uniref:Reverse transcriptase domain-containing protein n=1 Tax=Tanacetum coccineum TaxID=301880 RepID=A0ABQ5BGU3_9ASTR
MARRVNHRLYDTMEQGLRYWMEDYGRRRGGQPEDIEEREACLRAREHRDPSALARKWHKRATRSNIAPEITNTTSVTNAQLQAMINQGVTAALAARDANTNGVDSHNSGTGARRNERATHECTYPDFMKCQPLNFKGTKGVVELTQCIEKMETVTVGNELLLMQWNWTELKRKELTSTCLRTKIKKLEVKLWELKVKGLKDLSRAETYIKCVALFAVKHLFLKTFSKTSISSPWMHTRASNFELVKPLSKPKRTLNRRLRRRNKRVPFERRDERPAQPRIVYLPILGINYFRHFLDILEKYNPMEDEPMWAADCVVAPTPGSTITIPKTANEFTIKEMLRNFHGHNLTKGNIKKIFYHDLNEVTQEALNSAAGGIFLYKTPNQAYQLLEDKVLLKLDWAKKQKTKSSLRKTIAFAHKGSSNSNTDKIMARMDAMTMKMDAQYKEMQSYSNHLIPEYDEDDKPIESSAMIHNKVPLKLGDLGSFLTPCTFSKAFSCNDLADLGASINLMPYSLYAKLSLETLKPTKMSVRLADQSFQHPIGIAKNMLVEVGKFTFPVDFVILEMEEDSKVPLILGRPFLYTADAVIRVKQKQLNRGVGTERMTFSIDSAMKHSYSNNDTCFSIDVIDEILEKDFDALLDKGSEILHSFEGTILEEKLFAEFNEFMAMNIKETLNLKPKNHHSKRSPLTPIIKSRHLLKNLLRILN